MNNDNYFIEACLHSRGLPNEKKQSSFPTGTLPLKLTRQNIHYFLFSSQLIFQIVGSLFFNQSSIFFHVTAILRAVMWLLKSMVKFFLSSLQNQALSSDCTEVQMDDDDVFKKSFCHYFKKHYWGEVYEVPNLITFNSNLAGLLFYIYIFRSSLGRTTFLWFLLPVVGATKTWVYNLDSYLLLQSDDVGFFTKKYSIWLFSQVGEVFPFPLEELLMNYEIFYQDMLFLVAWPAFPFS